MAYRKKSRRAPRRKFRRRTYKKRSRALARSPLPRVTGGIFRYSDQHYSNTTLGALITYVYSANGMYDPNITGTGHQPRGFDQLMPMYDHYAVTSCRITVHVDNSSSAGVLFGIVPVDTFTPRGSASDYLEDRKAKWIHLSPINSGVSTKSISHYVDIGKFLGRKVKFEDDLKGSASANPADQVYWHIVMFNLYSTSDTGVSWVPVLDYSAALIEPKMPSQS